MDVAHTVRNLCVPTWCRVLLAPRLPPGAAGDSGRVLVSLGTKEGPPDRRGIDNDERRVVRTGEVGTVAAGRGQSKVRPVDTPIASSTRQALRISDANWQTQECAVLAQLSIPCWSRQQGKSSYPRMTAVSPCCTGERADHPRSISHLPASSLRPRARSPSGTFRHRRRFFALKKRHWGDACADAKRPNCAYA